MKQDEYLTVVNHPDTYKDIANLLLKDIPVLIAWTDEEGTQLDILFTLQPRQFGPVQGGVKGYTDIFVSIMRLGAFGFDISSTGTHPGYYAEKLHLGGGSTTEKLAELINEVKKLLNL